MKLPATVRKLLGLGEEQRSITGLPWDVGGPVSQGPVTADQALSLVPVFAAVRILAAQIASLPLQSFRKVGDQRTKIPMPSLFSAPSVVGTQFDWIHRCVTSMALRGNAYGLITQRNSLGYPTMIEWLHPDHVQVQDNAFSGPGSFTDPIWYWRGRTVPAEQMVHIPWFTVPYRVKGLSPMEACAAAVQTGVSAQDYTANWFLNGAVPPGVFKNIQKTIDQKEAEEIKSRLGRAIKTRAPLVHGNDWDYSPIAVAAHEAKFIETLKLTATQIANIYGVPPDQVGGDAGASGMTYRNENNSGLDFVKYTLRSWLEPLEEKFSGLLPQPQFVKFNLDSILRADLPTRMASYVEARNIGILSVNEIRALEDQPPIAGGDDHTPLLVQIAQSRGVEAAQISADKGSAPAVGQLQGEDLAEPTARLRAVVGYDYDAEELPLGIDAGPKGEPLSGALAVMALEARRRDPSDPASMEPVEDDELDEDSAALLAALEEVDAWLAGEDRGFNPNQPRIPKGSPGGGRFLSLADHLTAKLKEHHKSGGKGDPFDGYSREQLRRVAKKRGIELQRGEDRDSIAKKLIADLGPKTKAKKAAQKTATSVESVPHTHEPHEIPKLGQTRRLDWSDRIHDVSPEDREQIARELDVQAALTPRASIVFNGVRGSSDIPANVNAYYYADDRHIEVNGHTILGQHGSRRKTEVERASEAKGGRPFLSIVGSDRSDLQSTMAHEYGHHVDFTLRLAERDQLFAALAGELGVKPPPAGIGDQAYAHWLDRNKGKIYDSVSVYAAHNPRELMAEIWREYSTNPNARPLIRTVGDTMRRLAEGQK